jgi:lysophospholipase L1-like esterase
MLNSYANRAGRPPRLTLFLGDSIVGYTQQQITALFQPTACHYVASSSNPSFTTADLIAVAEPWAVSIPSTLVLNIGTNDVTAEEREIEAIAEDYDAILALFGDCAKVLVTTTEARFGAGKIQLAKDLNNHIKSLAGPNVRVADWAAAIKANTLAKQPEGPYTFDTVHPTAVGCREYARVVAAAARGL